MRSCKEGAGRGEEPPTTAGADYILDPELSRSWEAATASALSQRLHLGCQLLSRREATSPVTRNGHVIGSGTRLTVNDHARTHDGPGRGQKTKTGTAETALGQRGGCGGGGGGLKSPSESALIQRPQMGHGARV